MTRAQIKRYLRTRAGGLRLDARGVRESLGSRKRTDLQATLDQRASQALEDAANLLYGAAALLDGRTE